MSTAYKGRREDERLLTGAGRYTDDWDRPGQLHAVFLRADRAHAILLAVNVAEAQAASGLVAVLTAADMQAHGASRGHAHVPFKGRGEAIKSPSSPALAQDRVRYVGEPIAIVVAETAHGAQDALERITIDYL